MGPIFISYRRRDNTQDVTWRLLDDLRTHGYSRRDGTIIDMDVFAAGDFQGDDPVMSAC
jgi:hypothetical protein